MQRIVAAVDKHRDLILEAERYVWKHPETGYKELETSRYMEEQFIALGYELKKPKDLTGFCTEIDTGKEGPTLLILGELDSIICPAHKDANPTTGAVHSCGHNAQCAALLGIAAALKEEGILEGLCGKIRLCAVPAEELLEIEYRSNLKAEGKIKYFGGKTEFLWRGMFDGVDLAFMIHMSTGSYAIRGGSVGCLAKRIIYRGKAAHAGGAPWDGRNALYAASCGMNAANALRETFREADLIRFHPIITSGGAMVNAIPEVVTMESYVRGRTYKAIIDANKRINRALVGAAISLGVNVEIVDFPGYAPLEDDQNLMRLGKEAYEMLDPEGAFGFSDYVGTGSTDMGELSRLMPVLHGYAAGARGTDHGNDYEIADPESACVKNAKWQLILLRLLLENGAARAKEIVENYTPEFASKQEFFAFVDSLNDSGERIEYAADGSAKARLE